MRPVLITTALLVALLSAGCGDEAKEPVRGASSELPGADPAEPAGEDTGDATEDATDEPTATESGAEDPSGLPDMPTGGLCEADLAVSGDATGTLESGTFAGISDGEGPQAFYQAMGEDLLLSAYSEGNGIEPNLILQAGTVTYVTDPGTPLVGVAADGSGLTLDAEVVQLGGGDKTAQVTGTMTC